MQIVRMTLMTFVRLDIPVAPNIGFSVIYGAGTGVSPHQHLSSLATQCYQTDLIQIFPIQAHGITSVNAIDPAVFSPHVMPEIMIFL